MSPVDSAVRGVRVGRGPDEGFPVLASGEVLHGAVEILAVGVPAAAGLEAADRISGEPRAEWGL
jgi:hypothetical protein